MTTGKFAACQATTLPVPSTSCSIKAAHAWFTLPSNYAYEKAKKACRLDRKDIFVSENEVRVGLQAQYIY